MALRTILKKDTDEESLRKKSRPVTVFDQRLHNMIDDSVQGFFSNPLGYKYFMHCTIAK